MVKKESSGGLTSVGEPKIWTRNESSAGAKYKDKHRNDKDNLPDE